jgi:N-methylhydantoinase B
LSAVAASTRAGRSPLALSAIIREALGSIVREMRRAMVRSSYSSIIYEGYDFSCVLIDGQGRLVAESGEDHPFHIIPIAGAVAGMQAIHGQVGADEIVLHNDPYSGGTHLNDVAVIWPVHDRGTPVFHVVIRSHWGDIGGMSPGSLNGAASEIIQEGLRLNYIRLPKSGDSETMRMIFDNVRATREAASDFRTVLGICRIAEQRLHALLAKYGRPVLERAIDDTLDASEARLRAAIAKLPKGTWRHTGFLDGAAATPHPLMVQVALTVIDDRVIADFSGSSTQVAAPLNAGPAIAPTSVLTVLKAFLDPSGAINSGTLRAVEVRTPQGTIVNAVAPAPCGGLNEIRFACDAAVMGALGQIIPARLAGDVRGTSNHTYIGSPSFIFYEYPSGGTGAFERGDGAVAVRAFNEGENVSVQSAEVVEAVFPLRVLRSEIRADSGGEGKTRGGCGMRREVEVLCGDASLSVLSDRNIVPPAGVNGGGPGAPNRYRVRRAGVETEPSAFPGKVANFRLQAGDVVVVESSGGGGYGDPSLRSSEACEADRLDGYVTGAASSAIGGLVSCDEFVVDDRLSAPGCRLSPALARSLGAELSSLIEVVYRSGPARRLWVSEIESRTTGLCLTVPSGLAGTDPVGVRCLARRTPFAASPEASA